MTSLMNEMIREATAQIDGIQLSGGAVRTTEHGEVRLYAIQNSSNGSSAIQKQWKLNGKRIAAAKLAAM